MHAVGLGAMALSIAGRPPQAQALAVIRAFVEGGGNFIDTANVYSLDDTDIGHSERLVGRALDALGARDQVVVATKGGLRRPHGQWVSDGRPHWLRESCAASLRALGVQRIDLYHLHAVDPAVPIEDSMGALVRLQEAGWIAHIGVSNVDAAQLERARAVAQVVSVQNRCNVLEQRDLRSGLLARCARDDIAYLPHSSVGGHHGHVRLRESKVVAGIAARHGVTPYQVAVAWLLAQGENVIPIPGAARVESVRASLAALRILLTPAEIAALDALADG